MTDLETGTTDLLAEVRDGVCVLTMNRPERRNALSAAMLAALDDVLARVERDDDVRCVVLTGAGGAFCAGGDVKDMAATPATREGDRHGRSVDTAIHRQRLNQRATSGRLWSMGKPTIAAIGGPAAGAGLSLALACDLRYAVDGAILTTAFARVGLAGDYGGAWLLAHLVGVGRAKEMFYFSEKMSALDAERLGVVNAVFSTEAFESEVMDRAKQLASGPALAYRYMKENLNRASLVEFGESMDVEVTHHIHSSLTEDHREASRAFVEKREPNFLGR